MRIDLSLEDVVAVLQGLTLGLLHLLYRSPEIQGVVYDLDDQQYQSHVDERLVPVDFEHGIELQQDEMKELVDHKRHRQGENHVRYHLAGHPGLKQTAPRRAVEHNHENIEDNDQVRNNRVDKHRHHLQETGTLDRRFRMENYLQQHDYHIIHFHQKRIYDYLPECNYLNRLRRCLVGLHGIFRIVNIQKDVILLYLCGLKQLAPHLKMNPIYDAALSLGRLLALLTARLGLPLKNSKLRKFAEGQRHILRNIQERFGEKGEKPVIWIHAASLGEYGVARPVIRHLAEKGQHRIVLTFFSPTGYEALKDRHDGIDCVFYLPLDTPGNVKRFLDMAQPYMAFFIKYEFWQNYLNELQRRNIPVYSVSSIFRKEQIFFRWYGKSYRKVLNTFTHLFVQDEASVQLLRTIGITNTTVVGDTRFDRVLEICHQAKELPLVEKFKGNHTAFVAGSSWGPDEDIFIPYLNAHPEVKLIIAPHVIDESHLKEIIGKLNRTVVRYTQATEEKVKEADCLLIDCFGLLSSIYRYGEIAYIGGGFGVGIHNVLEAAVYGMPVIFGPNNKRFREAQGLLQCKGGFEIQGAEDFKKIMDNFLNNYEALDKAGKKAGNYVRDNAGALEKIMHTVTL